MAEFLSKEWMRVTVRAFTIAVLIATVCGDGPSGVAAAGNANG